MVSSIGHLGAGASLKRHGPDAPRDERQNELNGWTSLWGYVFNLHIWLSRQIAHESEAVSVSLRAK